MPRPKFLVLLYFLIPLSPAIDAKEISKPSSTNSQLRAYTVLLSPGQAEQLRIEHFDITRTSATENGQLKLEIIMTEQQAQNIKNRNLEVSLNTPQASSSLSRSVLATPVFRPYSGEGGLQQEMLELSNQYPQLTRIKSIGKSVNGTEILAIKVGRAVKPDFRSHTKSSRKFKRRPAVLYVSAQHAREWITTEVNRRLLRYFLENYGTDDVVTSVVDTTDLWFVLAANPDGYDFTFTEGNRFWRKNLADNDGDGSITIADGVDPNRNFPTNWGYDNEGSSSEPISGVFRGPSPASEPETIALDSFVRKIRPKFFLNYHSAAELILYGVGHQVATPTPDDIILAALAGNNDNPAVPGFDPDLSAELYTTNGETTEHMASTYGVLSFTPELSTCQSAALDPLSCESVFSFPDDEVLIQAEFEKNLPFALDIAQSAKNPFEPVSHLGNTVPDYVLDEFSTSHGNQQVVQATISRQIAHPILFYRINGGHLRKARSKDWRGGDRYGGDFNTYYRKVRAKIRGLQPDDQVEYWFAGRMPKRGWSTSETSTFSVSSEPANVLVIANEDYDGYTPEQFTASPKYLSYYTDALESNGFTYNVWDLDAQNTPHPLGVLAHYDAVIWYVGDNIITQDLADRDILFANSELGVAEVIQFTTTAIRDYLNEGGKLLKTGDRAGYFGQLSLGVLFYGEDGAPSTEPCAPMVSPFSECLIYSDDFHQYWLGDFRRDAFGQPTGLTGSPSGPLDSINTKINGSGSADNSLDAGLSLVTSSILPPDQYPVFANSHSIADYENSSGSNFVPRNGDYYIGVLADNNQYNRFSRSIDLRQATNATLNFATTFDIEPAYDFFVVEARIIGSNNWTTLQDINGNTSSTILAACLDGLWTTHPFIFDHYVDEATCTSPGPTGEFHPFNGTSDGWVNVSFDLSGFAGSDVEISLSYISDVGFPLTGVFVDDLAIQIDGVVEEQGWELDQTPWSSAPPPLGSPNSLTDWQRSTGLISQVLSAAVATDKTVYLPFGFEAISGATERQQVMKRLLDYLMQQDTRID